MVLVYEQNADSRLHRLAFVAERLRRQTRNLLGSPRAGSNPAECALSSVDVACWGVPFLFFFLLLTWGLPGMPLLGLQPTCAYGGVWEDIVTYGFFYHSVLVYTYSQTHAPSPLRPLTELWSHAPLGESRSRAE